MNHVLGEMHEAHGLAARRFASEWIATHAERWDRDQEIPREVLDALAGTGLLGAAVPLEWGGLGGGVQVTSRGCTGAGSRRCAATRRTRSASCIRISRFAGE